MNYPDPIEITRDAVTLAGSQSALARMAGIAQQSVSKILAGQIDPRRRTLDKIMAAAMRLRRRTSATDSAGVGESTASDHSVDAAAGRVRGSRLPTLYLPMTFVVPGDIVAWKRARRSGNHYYTDPDVSAYVDAIQREVFAAIRKARPRGRAGVLIVDKPVAVTIRATFRSPKKRLHGEAKTTKPDADNVGKLVLDALTGIVYPDDAAVARLTVAKVWGPTSELLVRVEAI